MGCFVWATDWKSVCPWFKSRFGHHLNSQHPDFLKLFIKTYVASSCFSLHHRNESMLPICNCILDWRAQASRNNIGMRIFTRLTELTGTNFVHIHLDKFPWYENRLFNIWRDVICFFCWRWREANTWKTDFVECLGNAAIQPWYNLKFKFWVSQIDLDTSKLYPYIYFKTKRS